MNKEIVIGLDCGTSAVKAVVWNSKGQALGLGRYALKIDSPRPGWHEQNAEDWLTGSLLAIKEALKNAGAFHGITGEDIAAIGLCHQRETFVPVDRQGKPLRNAILWMDERSSGLLPEIAQCFDDESFRKITGKTISSNLTFTKIEYLRREEPDVFKTAKYFLDVQAFVIRGLTGQIATGWGSADPTGLFDMGAQQWSSEILDFIGMNRDRLPQTYAPGTIAGTLTNEAATACGLRSGIPVVTGLGDGQCAGLGCGIAGPGESYLSLGTSIVSGTYSDNFLSSAAFRTSFGEIGESYFLETVILGGAYTVMWYLENFKLETDELRLRKEAEDIAPGCESLMVVPYWNSAMNPYWDSNARGITIGWSGRHGQAHFYRAILEGLAYEQRLHSDGVENALNNSAVPGSVIKKYVVSGGGAQNDLWLKIIADVTGRCVVRSLTNEAGALGAGILASVATGIHSSVKSAAKAMSHREESIIEPDPIAHDRYDALYNGVYVKLYPTLADSFKRVNDLSPR